MNQVGKSIPGGRSLLIAILQALAILAASVGLSQVFLMPLIQEKALNSVQRWEVEYLNGGTIELVADLLNAVPADQREVRLAELAPRFGYTVSLRDVREVDLDAAAMERLRNHEVVGDAPAYSVFRMLSTEQQVLVFENTKLPAGHLVTEAQRRHMGTLAVLETILDGLPQDTWAGTVKSAAEDFGYPVQLRPVSSLEIEHHQKVELDRGLIVTVATEDSVTADYPAEFIYKKIGSMALVLGPLSPPTLQRYYPAIAIYFVFLGLIVLLPIGLWLAPTWRSMNKLSRATTTLGQGNFEARVARVRGSQTNHFADVFNQMAGKIQSLIESNKALINAVSHELRTPISRIEFNIELARQSTDLAERDRHLERIEGSVDELKTMISEMLQYARFDREKPRFEMESVEIGEWLQSERENWVYNDAGPGIQIVPPEKAIPASLERYYMSRVISNLIRNATIYARSTILVSAAAKDDYVEIAVSDDGPGIQSNERTKIFEPFVRLSESRNRETGGTGLGLAIVKQIVEWHSGKVWVEESESGGRKVRRPLAAGWGSVES